MSSITSDILRIIDCAGADPTFTEVFARHRLCNSHRSKEYSSTA